jgi:cytochrome c-type biogenesis protein
MKSLSSSAFGRSGSWIAVRRFAPFILVLIIIFGSGTDPFPTVAQTACIEAPSFTLTSIDGTNFSLSDFSGKVVVLDLMATWCSACNAEMKELEQLKQEYSDVVIMTISVDPTESDEALRSFRDKHNADWLFARDTDNVWGKYRNLYLPTIVIIDPQGCLSFQKADIVPAEELIAVVTSAYSVGKIEPKKTEEPEGTLLSVTGLYLLALLTGFMSFFAPCAFPLLPGYISYYLGREEGETTLRGSVKAGIAAATGINGIFALVGVAVAVGGVAVKSFVSYLAPVVGFVVILLGLTMVFGKTGLFDRFGGLLSSYSSKIGAKAQHSGLFMYGVGYGLASMGCQAPVFIALIMTGLVSGGALEAFLVFISFSIGMGSMMLIVSVLAGTAKMAILERMKRLTPYISRGCGIILIIVGLYFVLEYL